MKEFSAEQIAWQQKAKRIAKDIIAPRAAEIDATDKFPWDIVQSYRNNGIFGIVASREYGGQELGILTFCLVIEEICKISGSCGIIASIGGEAGVFLQSGNEAQRKRYITLLASGEKPFVGFGLTEPGCGSDAVAIQTRAVREGDYYRINGTKSFSTMAGVADPVLIIVKTDPSKGAKGVSAFFVDKGTPGFRVGRHEDYLGLRGLECGELIFEDALVPKENMLGNEGEGFKVAMESTDFMRVAKGTQAIGLAQGAIDYTADHVRQSVHLGKSLAESQAVQYLLADMATQTEAARSLAHRVAAMVDSKEENIAQYSAMIKLFASETAIMVTQKAMQILGANGYNGDHPVERIMRDVKGHQIFEGTNQINRLVITRSLWGFR